MSRAVVGRATNNVAEIQAVTAAVKQAKKAGIKNLKINTDSQFLISCINDWMPIWKANGWVTSKKTPVINKVELLEMEEALKSLNVTWVNNASLRSNILILYFIDHIVYYIVLQYFRIMLMVMSEFMVMKWLIN